MEFTEEAFMKPYIDFNTEQRKNAQIEFEKDFWELMSKAVPVTVFIVSIQFQMGEEQSCYENDDK